MDQGPRTNIFNFVEPLEFLQATLEEKKRLDPALTLRRWATQLGLTSPDVLFQVFKRKRTLGAGLLEVLATSLGLDPTERSYFEVMNQHALATSVKEKRLLRLMMAELCGVRGDRRYFDDPGLLGHWVHMAILCMCDLKGFSCTRATIGEFLNQEVPGPVIDDAVDRLVRTGLVVLEGEELRRSNETDVSRNEAHVENFDHYYRQVFDLAKSSIERSVHDREFQCFALPIQVEHLPLFKDAIRSFRAKVNELGSTAEGNAVYQMNIQFFPLTKTVRNPGVLDPTLAPRPGSAEVSS